MSKSKPAYPFLFMGQGMSHYIPKSYFFLVFFEPLEKKVLGQILKLRPKSLSIHEWIEGSHILYVRSSGHLTETGETPLAAQWERYQQDIESWLKRVHAVRSLALVMGLTEDTLAARKLSYGAWHRWTVLDQGPQRLWPLIPFLWRKKLPKVSGTSAGGVPVTFETFTYANPLEEAFGEDWTGEETGGAMKEQMVAHLQRAVRFWEKELETAPAAQAAHFKKQLHANAVRMIAALKKQFKGLWTLYG